MMMSVMFVVVFWSSYETRVEDNNERALLSSSASFFLALHKMLTSQEARHCLVLVFLGLQRPMMSLLACFHLLIFFGCVAIVYLE
jgi:hypothetical protein